MKSPGREFSDAVHWSTAQWMMNYASQEVKVGDFGNVNEDTGFFEREGNIYEQESTAALAENYPPIFSTHGKTYSAHSHGVTRNVFPVDIASKDPTVASAFFKGHWTFERGGFSMAVIATRPTRMSVCSDLLKRLVRDPVFRTKSLVTEVMSSPAYAFYFSPPEGSTLIVALSDIIDSHSGHDGISWWRAHSGGNFLSAINGKDEVMLTPLFALQRLSRPGPHSLLPPLGNNPWFETAPWGAYDEDGEEQAFEDTIESVFTNRSKLGL